MRLLLATLVLGAPLYAQTCDFIVTPTTLTVMAAVTDGKITVTQPNPCIFTGWTAASNVTWLHITSGAGYSGNSTVTFTVDANITAFTRQGTMRVAGQIVTVTQDAALCNFAIAPSSQNFTITGGDGSFAV